MTKSLFPFLLVLTFISCSEPEHYNLIIQNGRIVDGSGEPSYVGDLAINADIITVIDDLGRATVESRWFTSRCGKRISVKSQPALDEFLLRCRFDCS